MLCLKPQINPCHKLVPKADKLALNLIEDYGLNIGIIRGYWGKKEGQYRSLKD